MSADRAAHTTGMKRDSDVPPANSTVPETKLLRAVRRAALILNVSALIALVTVGLCFAAAVLGMPDPLPPAVDRDLGLYGSIGVPALVALVCSPPLLLVVNVLAFVLHRRAGKAAR